MKLGKTFYPETRSQWHAWLKKHHASEAEIWVVYYRKETGKPRISYNDAVDEALCFGWIDSTLKRVDEERFAQRFTPRKPKSNLSQANKERIHKLIAEKKMTEAGLTAVAHVYTSVEEFDIPPEILKPLKANKEAWKNFKSFPESYKRVRIAYIVSRRRHGQEMFERSLNHFIKMTAWNKRIGFIRE